MDVDDPDLKLILDAFGIKNLCETLPQSGVEKHQEGHKDFHVGIFCRYVFSTSLNPCNHSRNRMAAAKMEPVRTSDVASLGITSGDSET
jgi:hypothetical protein